MKNKRPPHTVLGVLQVVAGANYRMTLQLVETNCRKGSPVTSACSAAPGKVHIFIVLGHGIKVSMYVTLI